MAPKNKAKRDSLFLLEVLVDKIVFSKSPCFSDGSFKTCVNVTAPFVEEMEICDDESGITSGTPFVKNFNSGKSCLFFMKEGDIKSAMDKFLIQVEVFKTLPCGCLPTKIRLGKAEIDMTKEFALARNQNLHDPNTASYQALQDSFRLIGEDKSDTAEIIMFLRLSCFGSLIVTKFQGGGGPMSFGTGQGTTDNRSCNPSKPYHTPDDPCVCGAHATSKRGSMGSIGQPSCRGGGHGTCPPAQDPYRSMPCTEPDDACFCSGPHPVVKTPLACRNTDAYCLHIPKDCCPPGNKVIFQLPTDTCGLGHRQRIHFNLNSDGVGEVAREEPGQLVPITSDDYSGVVYDLPKQVIKLRVGKTIEVMSGRKSKLEYQFITPVTSEDKEVPVNDTRTSQWLPCCPACCGVTHDING